jgi:putative acetyltransferase
MLLPANETDYAAIMDVWELSVRATHHFLPEDYLQHIKTRIPSFFPQVQLYVERDEEGQLTGFLGVADTKIEMLFIHPHCRGKGIGRRLTQFAIQQLKAREVDVNEQNEQAVGFYKRMGFAEAGRSETDGLGKPFPLLQMKLA